MADQTPNPQTLPLDGSIELAFDSDVPLWLSKVEGQSAAESRLVARLGPQSNVTVLSTKGVTSILAIQIDLIDQWLLHSSTTEENIPLSLDVRLAGSQSEGVNRLFENSQHTHPNAAITLLASDITIDLSAGALVVSCEEIGLTSTATRALGGSDLDIDRIGTAVIRARITSPSRAEGGQEINDDPPATAGGIGPDVIVAELQSVSSHPPEGDLSAYTFGTTSCNIGDVAIGWVDATNDHPVIGGSIYRLRNGRIEQLGISWLKHGIAALTGNLCGTCQIPPTSQMLGPMCSDVYSAVLNGHQEFLGPRSEINPHNGIFPFPPSNPPWSGFIARRIQVHNTDLDPTMNQGAIYFGESIYITPDDAAAGNGNNNASYVRVGFQLNDNNVYFGSITGQTVRQKPAIRAWKAQDPLVEETDIQVPNDGLFIVSAKASQLGNGFWHYEYAIMNQNNDRGARYFTIPIPDLIVIENMGFHDVDYHSGEPYSLTDWSISTGGNAITWTTEGYFDNPNANALRWSTMYNFRFDANVEPTQTTAILGLFKPGLPSSMNVATVGPSLDLIDCNGNGIADSIDVGDGTSDDCDSNMVPDECQLDCNMNGVADSCDIASGLSEDCNTNTLPDECETDCDGDGTIDGCEVIFDTDDDGILDCDDDCPATTPAGACLCPAFGECCFEFFGCFSDYPHDACCENSGVPDCAPDCESPGENCYNGCLIGDYDLDGDLDLHDFLSLGECFSGPNDDPSFVEPTGPCKTIFGFDEDNDIDLIDYTEFYERIVGP